MANETVGVNINVKTNVQGSIGELKALKKQLKDTAAGSEDFKRLSNEIDDLEDKIKGAKQGAGDWVDQLAAAPGPLGAVGNAINKLKVSTVSFGTALKATGIGLFVAAIGGLIAAFSESEKASKKLQPILNGFQKIFNGIFAAIEPVFDSLLAFAESALPAVTKGFGVAYSAISAFLQGIGLLGTAVSKLIGGDFSGAWDSAKEAVTGFGDRYEAANKRFIAGTQEVTSIEKEELEKRKAAQEKAEQEAAERAKKRKEQEEAERQKREEDTKAAYEKARQLANEVFLAEIEDKRMQDEIKAAQQYEKDKAEIEQTKATQEAKNAALLALDAKYKQDLEAIKKADDEKKLIESENELTRLLEQLTREEEVNREYLERDKKLKEEYNAADLEATQELQQRKFEAVNAGIDLISSLAGKSEVIGNILYTIQKAIEIGKIISSTSSAIAQVSASTAAVPAILPPGVPNPAYPIAVGIGAKKIAGLKIAAGVSIASIIASSIAKFKSGGAAAPPTQAASAAASGGAGGAAPIAPNPPLVNTRTQLDSQSIQQLGSATNRAYVVESDITNSQERIRRINRAARLS